MQNEVKTKIRKADSSKEWLKSVVAEFCNAVANKGLWMELSDLRKELENKWGGGRSSRNKDSNTIANRPHVKAWWENRMRQTEGKRFCKKANFRVSLDNKTRAVQFSALFVEVWLILSEEVTVN